MGGGAGIEISAGFMSHSHESVREWSRIPVQLTGVFHAFVVRVQKGNSCHVKYEEGEKERKRLLDCEGCMAEQMFGQIRSSCCWKQSKERGI